MKTVLITGASSGFGYHTALLLARNGYKVFAGVRNLQKKESLELKKIAEEEKLSIQIIQLDVTEQNDVNKLKDFADSIDVLINNAGIGFLGAAEEFTVEEVKQQFEVNYFGVIRITKAILPSMRIRKSGMIINISSINGLISFPLYGIYSSSKFALETYSEALRFEVHPFNIQIALVEPGSFLTNFTTNKYFPKVQVEKHSTYVKLTQPFFSKFNSFDKANKYPSMNKILNPDRVARKILQIIQSKNPHFHNIIGFDAHCLYLLNNILPRSLKDYLLRKVYKWS